MLPAELQWKHDRMTVEVPLAVVGCVVVEQMRGLVED